ncbi:MAG: hypothetical protein KAT05_13455 [Spirochaetes bacterium]|nr:hypothetical protein [Spirochaetota bacterium]
MNNNGWVLDTTLGKSKDFLWKIDNEYNIHISRVFIFENEDKNIFGKVSYEELNEINDEMNDGKWKDLANNVGKMYYGTEKAGIGNFMFNNLNNNTTFAQLSSHLGAIFYNSNVWAWNGKRRGIQFKRISDNWQELVENYYNNSIKTSINTVNTIARKNKKTTIPKKTIINSSKNPDEKEVEICNCIRDEFSGKAESIEIANKLSIGPNLALNRLKNLKLKGFVNEIDGKWQLVSK